MKQGYVYIVTNLNNTVLYTGVTSDLVKRVYQHKNKLCKGFTAKYNCNKLVYFEVGEEIESCILREKQIKAGSRKKKMQLIEEMNPDTGGHTIKEHRQLVKKVLCGNLFEITVYS